MKLKRIIFALAGIVATTTAVNAQSYFDDDIYYDASKATKKTQPKKVTQTYTTPSTVIVAEYPAADTYTVRGTRSISVDDYNRRGIFATYISIPRRLTGVMIISIPPTGGMTLTGAGTTTGVGTRPGIGTAGMTHTGHGVRRGAGVRHGVGAGQAHGVPRGVRLGTGAGVPVGVRLGVEAHTARQALMQVVRAVLSITVPTVLSA